MKTFREFFDLTEIERYSPSGFRGGKQELHSPWEPPRVSKIHPLPSHAGYGYTITPSTHSKSGLLICHLFDLAPRKHGFQDTTDRYAKKDTQRKDFTPLIGELSAFKHATLDTEDRLTLYKIGSVTVDEQAVYRNKGLGLAMYLLLLQLPGVALVAGESQTPAGRKQWITLAAHPAVQVDGMIVIPDKDFTNDRTTSFDRKPQPLANTLFGTLGVDYLGATDSSISHRAGLGLYRFFTFPVISSEIKNPAKKIKELMAAQKHRWTQIYGSLESETTLIARLKDAR